MEIAVIRMEKRVREGERVRSNSEGKRGKNVRGHISILRMNFLVE